MTQLGVSDRASAVAEAIRRGLVQQRTRWAKAQARQGMRVYGRSLVSEEEETR